MIKKIDLGAVSAYALAVENGYTGTEEEFAELLTNALNYATQAQESASAAAGSAEEAGRYKTQAGEILANVNLSGTQQIEAIEAAGTQQTNAAKEAIEAKGKETLDSIPDSYETLQGDVTQLRGDLDELDSRLSESITEISNDLYNTSKIVISDDMCEQGSLNSSTGANSSSTDARFTRTKSYIKINKGSRLHLISGNHQYKYVLFSEQKVGSFIRGTDWITEDTIIDVDCYLRIATKKEIEENTFTLSDKISLSSAKELKIKCVKTLFDFGAIGDGNTDDTEAIQKALDYAICDTIVIPKGTFLFSKTLIIKNGCHLVGFGENSILKLSNPNDLSPIVWRTSYKYPYITLETDSDGCVLENFALIGDITEFDDRGHIGINICGNNHRLCGLIIRDINYFPESYDARETNAPAYGINIFNAHNVNVDGINAFNCGYECMGTEDSTDVFINGCIFGHANRTSVQFHRGSKNINISDCTIINDVSISGRSGITMHGLYNHPVEDVRIVGNKIFGKIFGVFGGEYNISIIGNHVVSDTDLLIATGVSNDYGYDTNWIVSSNVLETETGYIRMKADNVMISGNIIKIDTVLENAVLIYGNHVSTDGNMLNGSNKNVSVIPH